MKVYRIAKTPLLKDLSGSGARIYGGRWNHKGTSLIYTAESRALATVEYLVHTPLSIVPAPLSLATLHIPDKIVPVEIAISDLPNNWREYPAPSRLADLGTTWAAKSESLLLRVPSAVITQEFNILVNPLHPDMKRVTILHIERYTIDSRLLR